MTSEQHQPYNQNPYSGGDSFHPPQQPEKPAGSGKKVGLIAGGVVAGLIVLAGGAYAVTNLTNAVGDKDIATAAPGTTAMFAQVDLNPSNGQKAGALALAAKIDKLAGEDAEYKAGDKSVKEIVSDAAFESLDYESEVEPFLGDKAAVATWGDFGSLYEQYPSPYADPFNAAYDDAYLNGEYDQYIENGVGEVSVERAMAVEEETADAPDAVLIYEVKDEGKAEEAAKKAVASSDSTFKAYTVQDGYLILSDEEDSITAYKSAVESGNLADNELYKADISKAGDNVASAWLDASKLGTEEAFKAQGIEVEGTNAGTGLVTVSLGQDGMTVQAKTFNAAPVFDAKWYKDASLGLEQMGNIDSSAVMAASINDMPIFLEDIQNVLAASGEDMASYNDTIEMMGQQLGVNLPEEWVKITGDETSFGLSVEASGESGSIQYRASGGDSAVLENILGQFSGSGMMPEGVTVEDADGAAVIEFTEGDIKTGEPLSSSDNFKKALPGLDKAQVAFYVDATKIPEMDGSEISGSDIGAMGVTGTYNADNDSSEYEFRWVY